MIKFTPRIPNYVDAERVVLTFNSFDDMIMSETFTRFSNLKNFSHFAIEDNYVMAVLDDGFKWLAVGKPDIDLSAQFVQWDGGKYKALMPDGSIAVLTSEVHGSSGDSLFLENGVVATWIRTT